MGAFGMVATDEHRSLEELVQLARRGDSGAFEEVYRAQAGRVYAICLRIAGDRAAAEDLAQETFVRAWRKLGAYEPGTNFPAWIAKVAVNTALSDRRSVSRREARETTRETLPEPGEKGEVATSGERMDLERAIASLPPAARRVFVLHDVEGYRHREIAAMLGLSTGTTKAQLHRARAALRKDLGR